MASFAELYQLILLSVCFSISQVWTKNLTCFKGRTNYIITFPSTCWYVASDLRLQSTRSSHAGRIYAKNDERYTANDTLFGMLELQVRVEHTDKLTGYKLFATLCTSG